MKTSTYGIIGFLLLIVLVDAAVFLAVASTGRPRAEVYPENDPRIDIVDTEVDEEIEVIEPEATPSQGRIEVEVDMPMTLVMPEGSVGSRPLDGTVYDADTLVIISRTHSLRVR